MRAKGIIRKVERANSAVQAEISAMAAHGHIASAMASEGYNGGYMDALQDVLLALYGNTPNRNGWWKKEGGER